MRPSRISPQVLIARTAEPRVDVLIVGLKPIAETRAQHAGGGSHAAAFQNVVLAIEELRRVPGVAREGLESGERSELRRRPLPSVAEQPLDAERAPAQGARVHRRRVPRSVTGNDRPLVPPRILAF